MADSYQLPPATPSESPSAAPEVSPEEQLANQRRLVIGIVLAVIVVIALAGVAVWFLLQPTVDTERIRDVFIIFIALQTLLIGFVLIILVYQLARLINLLQNEIKPILDATNQTASTLRGTAAFMSDHLAEPVIRLNEYVAALQRILELLNLSRRKP
jgi:membrane protein implicated in regulation of membrane protease activity